MTKHRDPLTLAINYHEALPRRIRAYLNNRGIPDVLINFHLLGWNSVRITIPIFNREGQLIFFKLAKDPEDPLPGPKMLAPPGVSIELYGWEQILSKPSQLIICEGEFDRLVLETHSFRAVTSTGGAGTFRSEWVKEFEAIPEIYICFDRDDAGRRGALRVGRMIPHSRLVELPEEVGEGGDITDYFVRLRRSSKDLLKLLEQAQPAPPLPQLVQPQYPQSPRRTLSPSSKRVERIKAEIPINRIIGQYVKLRISGNNFVGLCPFHEDHYPSLTVYTASGTFHCFGCRKHGDVITFLMEIEHLTFPQALDSLDLLIKNQNDQEFQRNS